MRISGRIDYSASPERVFAMLSDQDFQQTKCAATGALSSAVSITEQGERTLVVTRRTLPTSGFPEFVKGFVGATLTITQTESWGPGAQDGSREGSLHAEIAGAPVGITGSLRLSPDEGDGGGGTVEVVELDLRARVPLVGGRIEAAAAPAVEAGIAVERRTGQAWLQQH